MRHNQHYEPHAICMVRMIFPKHIDGPKVQIFDTLQAAPREAYPYWYEPSLPSLNRLFRVIQGWSVKALESGAWEWRKPENSVKVEALKDIRDLLRTSTPPASIYTFEEWPEHKCNRAAGDLTILIEKMEEKI